MAAPIAQGEWAILGLCAPIKKHREYLQRCTNNGRTDRDAVCRAELSESKEACIRWESRSDESIRRREG